MTLTAEQDQALESLPPTLWSQGNADVGLMKGVEPVIIRPKTEHRPKVRQYPLKPDAIEGIRSVITDLRSKGIIRPCSDSPVNTAFFPVQKAPPSTGWRMVQDMRPVNESVIVRSPNVPDPPTLLNQF